MNGRPTRRSFFGRAGAALAAPFAANVACAGELDGDRYAAGRLAALEDVNAIRALQLRYARLVTTGNGEALGALFAAPALEPAPVDELVRGVVVDGADEIAIEGYGRATARLPCIVTTATPIESCGTLVEMAWLQGDGFVTRSERRILVSSFVKIDGAWKIDRAEWVEA